MNYKELLKDRNDEVRERTQLSAERLHEIAMGEESRMDEALKVYFRKTAHFLENCLKIYKDIEDDQLKDKSLEELRVENFSFYQELLPENYENSYANPDCATKLLGEDYGRLLCFLYTELRSLRVYAYEQDLFKMTILIELFLEVYGMFLSEEVSSKQLKENIYWFYYDYADEWCGWRVREFLDPELSFATDIVMKSDLSNLRYLYEYGEYISENEWKIARFLNTFSQEEIDEIAHTFTEGYRRGFELKNVDLGTKNTVNIIYNIGFERVVRAAIMQFAAMGLKPVIYRSASCTLNKKQNKNGYVSVSINEQFDYDHRFDSAIYLDKRMVDRKITCMRKAYEEYRDIAASYAGPAVMEVFGGEPFSPVRKESALRLSERQQGLTVEYSVLASEVMSEFINLEERSFTIIDYPIPAIGEKFEEIFHEIQKVNNLDNDEYKDIQQTIIDVLDKASAVHILGRGKNMTNLMVALQDIEDIKTQTKFENCLADVNIPLGEVFTSPKLKGSTGLLHVTEVYLEGVRYKNLKIWLEDGMITDYSCDNFETEIEGRELIKESILYNRETLPMGEFAIGTNTTAYVMACRYGIMDKLPILIAEKMGPHMAMGDTCYSHCEEVKVYNPDGREMIAKDNDCSLLRKESPKKAYFNCHTDITIPYEEIGSICAVMPDHYQTPIILDGRFVLEGTMKLNEAFEGGN